jgi:hypothetical protein
LNNIITKTNESLQTWSMDKQSTPIIFTFCIYSMHSAYILIKSCAGASRSSTSVGKEIIKDTLRFVSSFAGLTAMLFVHTQLDRECLDNSSI